jgi:anthranilate/para-aminobenzoate synthase component II
VLGVTDMILILVTTDNTELLIDVCLNHCSQAGGSTVGMVFHKLTKPEHGLPSTVNHSAYLAFWGVNALLSVVPQIAAIRLVWLPVEPGHKVQQQKQKSKAKGQEKQNSSYKKVKTN